MSNLNFNKYTFSSLALVILGACGGGTSAGNAGFVIGGTITGLTGDKHVILQNNGNDELKVMQNGSFVFSKTIDSGSDYSVTVKVQPDGLNCAIDAGSGKATADIDNVKVKCTPTPDTDIAQLTGKWDALDSCRTYRAGLGYAISFLEANMQVNTLAITEGIRVYEKNDCKTKFMFRQQDNEPSTVTVRSAYMHEGIRIFRLSLASKELGTRFRAFWLPHQQDKLCIMDDDKEKTDEAISEKIISNPSLSEHCYSRAE